MEVDWASTGAMLTGIGTIGSAIAIMTAAHLGKKAAVNFREQKQAEREIEFAERAIAVAYQIDSALGAIRSPLSTGGELESSKAELEKFDWFDSKDESEKKRVIQANVFYQRIRRFEKEFDEALTVLPFVKAYFGAEAGDALAEVIRARNTVSIFADAYADDNGSDPEFSKEIRSNIWATGSQKYPDPVKNKVQAEIDKLEQILLPYIRSTVQAGVPAGSARQDD